MYRAKMTFLVNGKSTDLYTIGHVAKQLKKSVETLRAWERQKIMPKPMFMHKSVRLYHELEIKALKKAIKKAGKYARKEALQKEIWKELKKARTEITSADQ